MKIKSKRISNFTYKQSQILTTLEVMFFIGIATILWFADLRMSALVVLIWATVSLLAHFNRNYRPE